MAENIERIRVFLLALAACVTFAAPAQAAIIDWADWLSADSDSASGTVGGTTIDFTGNLNPAAQTSGAFSYWASNSSTYTDPPTVDNPPPTGDIIRLVGGTATGTQTLVFGQPVVDPVMAILSLGQGSVPTTYDFNTPFDILNNGPGYWGNGPLTELPGDILQGNEGHGLIQFPGVHSSISWTIPTAENWHGFTVGIAGLDREPPPAGVVPEPASLLLMGMGLVGGVAAKRGRRSA